MESTDHLYFACPFSNYVWSHIRQWLSITRRMSTLHSAVKWLKKEKMGSSSVGSFSHFFHTDFDRTLVHLVDLLYLFGLAKLPADRCPFCLLVVVLSAAAGRSLVLAEQGVFQPSLAGFCPSFKLFSPEFSVAACAQFCQGSSSWWLVFLLLAAQSPTATRSAFSLVSGWSRWIVFHGAGLTSCCTSRGLPGLHGLALIFRKFFSLSGKPSVCDIAPHFYAAWWT
ncbi:hypothetical protein Salat_1030100 [Sesamum alatum]|uniref:Reverse transcriptase zinc-binding domain-containing protein n=1 Tax=Sesamum alatum TaxID=300844 RepID=A0AAE2CSM1_9LAMI|nr:hypothetical protein Salat_1030100 [Sesamum alatum]